MKTKIYFCSYEVIRKSNNTVQGRGWLTVSSTPTNVKDTIEDTILEQYPSDDFVVLALALNEI